jgi:hypothetical protein
MRRLFVLSSVLLAAMGVGSFIGRIRSPLKVQAADVAPPTHASCPPLIRELVQYRDLIDYRTKEVEE